MHIFCGSSAFCLLEGVIGFVGGAAALLAAQERAGGSRLGPASESAGPSRSLLARVDQVIE